MSTLAIWCRVVRSRDVRSRDFSVPQETRTCASLWYIQDIVKYISSNLTHSLITIIDFIIYFIHFNGMLVAKFCPLSFIFNNNNKVSLACVRDFREILDLFTAVQLCKSTVYFLEFYCTRGHEPRKLYNVVVYDYAYSYLTLEMQDHNRNRCTCILL